MKTRWIRGAMALAFTAVVFVLLTLGADLASAQTEDPEGGKETAKEQPCATCRDKVRCPCLVCNDRWSKAVCFLCRGKRQLPCFICEGAGYFSCGACKGVGKILWEGGDADACKACGGSGKYKCGICKTSKTVKCTVCRSTGLLPFLCPTCPKTGVQKCYACQETPTVADCQSCLGKGSRKCLACDASGKRTFPCFICSAKGVINCPKCAGTKDVPCPRCSGCGRVRQKAQDGSKAGMIKCPDCDAKGKIRCAVCGDGFLTCPICQGSKRTEQTCWFCAGKGRLDCEVCARIPCLVARKEKGLVVYLLKASALTAPCDNFLSEALKLGNRQCMTLIVDNSGGEQDILADPMQNLIELVAGEQKVKALAPDTLVGKEEEWEFQNFGQLLFDLEDRMTARSLRVPAGAARSIILVFDASWSTIANKANLLLPGQDPVEFKSETLTLGDIQRALFAGGARK